MYTNIFRGRGALGQQLPQLQQFTPKWLRKGKGEVLCTLLATLSLTLLKKKKKKNLHPRDLVTWKRYDSGFFAAFWWVPWSFPAGVVLMFPAVRSFWLLCQPKGFDQPIPLGPVHPTIPEQVAPGQLPSMGSIFGF